MVVCGNFTSLPWRMVKIRIVIRLGKACIMQL